MYFHSKFNYKARGTAILIKQGIPFDVTKTISDINGHFIIVVGKLYGTPVVLANIYGPNWDDVQFFSGLIAALPDPNINQLILGGDFNGVLHLTGPILDQTVPYPNQQQLLIPLHSPTTYLTLGGEIILMPNNTPSLQCTIPIRG